MTKRGYLIAVDLDGTLLHNFDCFHRKSFRLLRKAARTNYVVIATGRPFRSTKRWYRKLKLDTPIVNYNGALVHHPKDPGFPGRECTLSRKDVLKIIDDNENLIFDYFCEIGDHIYPARERKEIIPYLHRDGAVIFKGEKKEFAEAAKAMPTDPDSMIIFAPPGSEETLTAYFLSAFQNRLKVRFWPDPNFVIGEIYNPEVSKGSGIRLIADFYRIPHEKTIAVGDGLNDLEMFQVVKYGVAVGDSPEELKKKATHIVPDAETFLKEFFGKDSFR